MNDGVSPSGSLGLFCVELLTSQWETMIAWYRETLGLRALVRMPEDQYALFAAGGTRIAILGRSSLDESSARRLRLVFEVSTLAVPPARLHPEGFLERRLADPDGNAVHLVAWPSGGKVD